MSIRTGRAVGNETRKMISKTGVTRLVLVAICGLSPCGNLRAAAASVTAVLSSSETAVGQPVQLQI